MVTRTGLALETVSLGLAPEAVRLRLDDARRVALHPDSQVVAEIDDLRVGETKFSRNLVNPDFRWHVWNSPFGGWRMETAPRQRRVRLPSLAPEVAQTTVEEAVGDELIEGSRVELVTKRATERLLRHRGGETRGQGVSTEPGSSPAAGSRDPSDRIDGESPQLGSGSRGPTADAGPQRLGTRGAHSLVASPSATTVTAAHSSAEIASLPSAGCHFCSPVSASMIHSPSAHSSPS